LFNIIVVAGVIVAAADAAVDTATLPLSKFKFN